MTTHLPRALLQRALRDVWQSHWPSDLDQCLQDRIRAGLIRARAHQLQHAQAQARTTPPPADRKRLAAGDTDKD